MNHAAPYILPPALPMWQWSEKHINLSMRQPTARRGMYQTDPTPYVRGIMDALQDPANHTCTIMKGAQTGLTLMAYCAMCYWICEDPDPILLVMPNADLGRSASETRLQPLIEDSARVAEEKTDDSDDFKKLSYVLRRCTLDILGSNSPANLASRPARYLVLDETDKYPEATKKEARSIKLAIERTKTYEEFRKIVEISTPTNIKGYIYQSCMRADQRKYYVPCAECGEMQTLEWEQVRFDSDVSIADAAASAYYECNKCGAHWSDLDKEIAVGKGEWRATSDSHDVGHVSFILPAFYAPWVKWADAVTEFLSTKDYAPDFQNFVNSTLAEPWTEPPKKSLAQSRIWEIRDENPYDRGVVPTDNECELVATVDIQAAHLVYAVWAMDLKNQWLIDHGQLAVLEDIDKVILQARYRDMADNELRVKAAFLDTGYDTMNAYKYCLRFPSVLPIKGERGRFTKQSEPLKPSKIESFPGGKMFGGRRCLKLLHIHPSFFKDELARAVAGEDEDGVNIWFHKAIDQDYVMQVTGEVLKEGKADKFGQTELYWEKIRTNDQFDLAQYGFAIRHMAHNTLLNLDRPSDAPEVEEKEPPKENECLRCGKEMKRQGDYLRCECGNAVNTVRTFKEDGWDDE